MCEDRNEYINKVETLIEAYKTVRKLVAEAPLNKEVVRNILKKILI